MRPERFDENGWIQFLPALPWSSRDPDRIQGLITRGDGRLSSATRSLRVDIEPFAHDHQGALADLRMNGADVLSQDPEKEELESRKEKDGDDQGGDPRRRELPVVNQVENQRHGAVKKA